MLIFKRWVELLNFGNGKSRVSAYSLRTFVIHLWVFALWQVKVISGYLHNVTDESFGQLCWNSSEHFICDPAEKLHPLSRRTLGAFLNTIPRDTPCFCNPPCSENEYTVFPTKKLAIGVVLPVARLSDRTAVHKFAHNLRSKWAPGACPGNDVLFFVLDSKVYIDYGDLSRNLLAPNCLASLPTDYKRADITLNQLATIVRDHFINPCPPTEPTEAGANAVHSWLKIPTMLLACLCLLLWLVFIGRRAHLRRLSASASAQLASRYHRSLFDLPPASTFSSQLLDRHHQFGGGRLALAFRPTDGRPCVLLASQRSLSSRFNSASAAGDDDEDIDDGGVGGPGYRLAPGGQSRRLSSSGGLAVGGHGEPFGRSHVLSRSAGRTPSPPPAYCSLEKSSSVEATAVPAKPLEGAGDQAGRATTPFEELEPDPAQAPPAYADVVQSIVSPPVFLRSPSSTT